MLSLLIIRPVAVAPNISPAFKIPRNALVDVGLPTGGGNSLGRFPLSPRLPRGNPTAEKGFSYSTGSIRAFPAKGGRNRAISYGVTKDDRVSAAPPVTGPLISYKHLNVPCLQRHFSPVNIKRR